MKFITWNVNGIRAVMNKQKNGDKRDHSKCEMNVITDLLINEKPDFLCLQEIKCNSDVDLQCIALEELGYHTTILNCAQRKGYSGTAIFSKTKPLAIYKNFEGFLKSNNAEELITEGRVITLEYPKFFIITAYVPNAKPDLSRLDFRINEWEKTMRDYINYLQSNGKYIIFCGDLNVAADNIDVHNPSSAKGSHGFTNEEKQAFKDLLNECNLVDSFRELHLNEAKYSWFSPFAQSRKKGKGWRIDYFLVSKKLKPKIKKTDILSDYYGSDHIPCMIDIEMLKQVTLKK